MLMLIFHVGNDSYCCSCEHVLEIVPKVALKTVPHAPTYLVGVLNYGGHSVPVIDFSLLVGDNPSKNSMHTRIILIKNPQEDKDPPVIGVLAEEIVETRVIDESLFNATGLKIQEVSFLDGIYNKDQESIQRVIVDELFKTTSV